MDMRRYMDWVMQRYMDWVMVRYMDLVMQRYMERPYMNDETVKYLGGRSLMMGTLHGTSLLSFPTLSSSILFLWHA